MATEFIKPNQDDVEIRDDDTLLVVAWKLFFQNQDDSWHRLGQKFVNWLRKNPDHVERCQDELLDCFAMFVEDHHSGIWKLINEGGTVGLRPGELEFFESFRPDNTIHKNN